MNRIVKRQGAAPPWVELNMELESELGAWRGRVADNWIRRASRMISTSPTLSSGLEPLPSSYATRAPAQQDAGEEASRVPSEAELKLLDIAKRYRDVEWEEREQAYHTLEVKRLNELIRKHNHLAPFTARKGLMMLDLELKAIYDKAVPRLVDELSSILHAKKYGGEGGTKSNWNSEIGQKRRRRFDNVRYVGEGDQTFFHSVERGWERNPRRMVGDWRNIQKRWSSWGMEQCPSRGGREARTSQGDRSDEFGTVGGDSEKFTVGKTTDWRLNQHLVSLFSYLCHLIE